VNGTRVAGRRGPCWLEAWRRRSSTEPEGEVSPLSPPAWLGKRGEDARHSSCMPWMSALAQELKGCTRRDGVNFDEEVVTG
jgi:hypothetical protein